MAFQGKVPSSANSADQASRLTDPGFYRAPPLTTAGLYAFRVSSGVVLRSSGRLQSRRRSLAPMYDLAAIGIAAACFAFAYLILWVLDRV